MDITTLLGLLVAFGFVLLGQYLEGGSFASILQPTAAFIVFGGTLGAVLVSFPRRDVIRGLKLAKQAIFEKSSTHASLIQELVELAGTARRDGLLALESRLANIEDDFMKRAVQYLVDGVDAEVARDALEAEIHAEQQESLVAAKVFESAGGYSPTIGIIGAVLGLIHVMENLNDPSKLGSGIAVAFVATVYGVGAANLVLLPVATKLKRKIGLEKDRKTLIVEGVLAIHEGLNPRVLEEKLKAYVGR
ncbi:MAG TPA: flagellar motor protein [Vulgatibacter sp.]|nr:flagellar motor protein [Vulgatibacter sp.]